MFTYLCLPDDLCPGSSTQTVTVRKPHDNPSCFTSPIGQITGRWSPMLQIKGRRSPVCLYTHSKAANQISNTSVGAPVHPCGGKSRCAISLSSPRLLLGEAPHLEAWNHRTQRNNFLQLFPRLLGPDTPSRSCQTRPQAHRYGEKIFSHFLSLLNS